MMYSAAVVPAHQQPNRRAVPHLVAEDPGQVGRFGVGFWSVLRFEPERIVIRSRPAAGEPWEVSLDGAGSVPILES